MERLTPEQKDQKYGPAAQLCITACKAHGEIHKANGKNKEKPGAVSPEEIQQLVNGARAADEAIRQATTGYTQDDIRIMAAYLEQAVVRVALTPSESGGLTFDVGAARGVVNAIQSLRHMPGVAENFVRYHLQRTGVFLDLCGETGYVPKYGMNTTTVRHCLERLASKIAEARKSYEAAKTAGQLLQSGNLGVAVANLNGLNSRANALFERWLAERQPATASAPIGEQVGSETARAVQVRAAPEATPVSAPARRPTRSRR